MDMMGKLKQKISAPLRLCVSLIPKRIAPIGRTRADVGPLLVRWTFKSLDWLYPRNCPGCGVPSDREGRHWCWNCFRKIEFFPQHGGCEICGQRVEGNVTHSFVCDVCLARRPHFDRARAAADFKDTLRDQILAFKYQNALWMRQDLCDVLEGAVKAHFPTAQIDVVIPVPLHPVRQRERTFNQAAMLAEALAERMDRRCDTQSLIRTRETSTQTKLHAAQRHTNISGAFQVKRPEWVAQRRILLVDDVMTTGATLDECARVLKQANARAVWAVTIARRKS